MKKKVLVLLAVFILILSFSFSIIASDIPEDHVRIHYLRPDQEYSGWGLHVWGEGFNGETVDWASPLKYDGVDDYSVYWDLPYKEGAGDLNFIIHKGNKKDPDPDRNWPNPDENREVWSVTGEEKVYLSLDKALKAAGMENLNIPKRPEDHVRLHYYRFDENYEDWGLHVWGEGYAGEAVEWQSPLEIDGKDSFGAFWDIPYEEDKGDLNFIIHKEDKKDIGKDRVYPDPDQNKEVWTVTGNEKEYTSRLEAEKTLDNDIISAFLTDKKTIEVTFKAETDEKILVKDGSKFVWIDKTDRSNAPVYEVNLKNELDPGKSYKVIAGEMTTKTITSPEIIDENFSYDGDLGAIYAKDETAFKLWAPLASEVELLFFSNWDQVEADEKYEMKKDENGVWKITVEGDLEGTLYQYSVVNGGEKNRVLDPYAKSMPAFDSFEGDDKVGKAAVVDLEKTNPAGWEDDDYIKVEDQEDVVIYEMHIRDFTISADSGVDDKLKGTYEGFKEKIPYLKDLGITHVQLMPLQNFYYGNELDKSFENKGSVGESNYNWGYDPHNYFTPEGWYSLDPENPSLRVKELKSLIKELHEAGIGVILDVVYNHTAITDTFEDIVPYYYYRRNEEGGFTSGSGCGNDTASRRSMVRKLIIDSTTYWVDEYNIDGFRFDLMGLHDETTMQKMAREVRKINPDIVLHGEGWDLGTLPADERFVKYSEDNHSLVEMENAIGAFNDGFRDALIQEYYASPITEGGFIQKASNKEDMLRTGIIAGIIDFESEMPINDDPYHRYADDPEESTMYVTCHDGYTLWDKIVASTPDASKEERIKMDKLTAAMVFTSQGRAFIHGGAEMLRSKPDPDREHGFDHNSYDSGDSTNQILWSRVEEYSEVVDYYKGLIDLKLSHEAFRMETMEEIQEGIRFIKEDIPYLMGFKLKEQDDEDDWKEIMVFYNSNREDKTVEVNELGADWKVVVDGERAGTEVLKNTEVEISEGEITIPAISAVVLYR